ncbi:MAG: c-type cytochrome [Flavobacteriales bacterium]|nr:c-type cytochrome [Flavobacteriales bacterium]MCL4281856.1 c-type cytochrome [Flavobacteriales bacterium]
MKRTDRKTFGTLILIGGFLVFSAFAAPAPKDPPNKNNLKVLPKDISHDDLMAIMHGFEDDLNFSCGDCHAKSATKPGKLDFASDDHPHKEVTREMMRMVSRINKKEFGIKGAFTPNYVNKTFKVSCYTCHHGQAEPANKAPANEKH